MNLCTAGKNYKFVHVVQKNREFIDREGENNKFMQMAQNIINVCT